MPPGHDPTPSQIHRAHVATSIVFVLNGWTFATWAGRIPDLKATLHLSPGQLGLLLLVGSAGSLVGLPSAGRLATRYGAARTVLGGAILTQLALAAVAISAEHRHDPMVTAAPLFITMLGLGLWDVAMNIEGAAVEHRLNRTVMPRYHAGFSLGTVLAAALASVMTATHIPLTWHFGLGAPIVMALATAAVSAFLPHSHTSPPDAQHTPTVDGPTPRRHATAWQEPRTLMIGAVTLIAAFTEGAANDWLSITLIDGHGLPSGAGVLGFAFFLTCMTAGRWYGADLLDRYGRVPLLRVFFLVAATGSLLVVTGTPWLAALGAGLWGIGVSLGFPVGMSAAADDPHHAAARVSVVSTIAYGAFLIGPPALGHLGDLVGMRHALLVVPVLLTAALAITPVLQEQRGSRRYDDPPADQGRADQGR
ncbi:Inner membrane protein YbjJ [Austwickia sp. TVS 96-490-7B]|uniref:MFS transporter n=1 Tax=Austwickia sp. TVS 96-490-7B TaxID=2830843 RepID=UPI001C5886EB|nr:MFS transporter [Austwickia sp. TVS 96-490-7B]MBW3085174.1 Inner membrane protein YbjJ [Austwickia sp. TVS 96-490-7B]